MTKKDYQLIAANIQELFRYCVVTDKSIWQITAIANSLAEAFQLTNPKFNRTKFLTACGIEEN